MRWRLRASRIFFLSIIAGGAFYLYDYKPWFALKNYKVEASSHVLERRLWEVFPQRSLTFWPYFFKDSKGLKEFLERDMPVIVDTQTTGFGKFTTKIEWLRAWVKVAWRDKIWCISRDGRMWLYDPNNKVDEAAGQLIWRIPTAGGILENEDIQVPEGGVFQSPIPTDVMSSFIDEFADFKWFEYAKEITRESRAGMYLFILKLEDNNKRRFDLYLQPEKYANQNLGATIEGVLSNAANGGRYTIDATYEGKIVLRGL